VQEEGLDLTEAKAFPIAGMGSFYYSNPILRYCSINYFSPPFFPQSLFFSEVKLFL
jgi:hypothetical protein